MPHRVVSPKGNVGASPCVELFMGAWSAAVVEKAGESVCSRQCEQYIPWFCHVSNSCVSSLSLFPSVDLFGPTVMFLAHKC